MKIIKSLCIFFIMCGTLFFTGCDKLEDGSLSQFSRRKIMPFDEAVSNLDRLMGRISWRENYTKKMIMPESTGIASIGDALPDIDQFDMPVDPRMDGNSVVVEIFVSTEKSGSGTDGWINEVAEKFNRSNVILSNGKVGRIAIRKIASGTGYQYIATGKYVPDAFSPSNHLWIEMSKAAGYTLTPVTESLVSNVAGIVMKNSAYKTLLENYQTVGVENIVDAVIQGTLFMGYTNPFASSTGLNFLYTVLALFADGEEAKMLAPEAISAFEAFQQGVPFVSLTTMQMRDSVEKGGALDAFVMEHQTYVNASGLKSGYEFIPFGILHDNPLYSIGDISKDKSELLHLFSEFTKDSKIQAIAKRYGFNQNLNYTPVVNIPSGEILVEAQKLWKEKKDSGRPILAVFCSDVSGSMKIERLKLLKEALVHGSKFIDPKNYIGLVVFDEDVEKLLPIKMFDERHQAQFLAAVQSMDAQGSTAMYNGIMVSLDMLIQAAEDNPEGKPMLFVLTDGETNRGLELTQVQEIIEGLRIPVYSISYGEDISELKLLSQINEAASIKAKEYDIAFQIGSLLNAEM